MTSPALQILLHAYHRRAGQIFVVVLISVALAACGGGGGDGNSAAASNSGLGNSTSVCSIGASYVIDADVTVTVGQSAGAALVGCTGSAQNPKWVQTAGAPVILYSDRTQAIGFDVPSAGSYSFRVSFTDDTGQPRTLTTAITATANTPSTRINARVDQAVRMGGRASIHAWESIQAGDAVASIDWVQIAGPSASIDQTDPRRLLITTPAVSRDELIVLRVTVRTILGTVASDDVRIVVEKFTQANAADNAALFRSRHVSRTYPYRATSPSAANLVPCVYSPDLRYVSSTDNNLCPLSRLSFLAQLPSAGNPTIEEIMDRVIVSHDWMGEVFEQYLRTQDPAGDLRRMLASTTAIVIAAHNRPSFYNAATGAIYLDARALWLTPEQRDVVDETADPRSTFDDALNYAVFWAYTAGNTLVGTSPAVQQRQARDLPSLKAQLGRLLYHELGHALDYQPPKFYNSFNPARNPWDNYTPRLAQQPSSLLSSALPLGSSELKSLAQVKFFGQTPTPVQTQYTPTQIGAFLAGDRGSDEYAYTNSREDAAMLIEEFLMAYRLGLRRNTAILDQYAADVSPYTLPVYWGQRGRIGETAIRPRIRFLLEQMVPWIDPASVNSLDAPIPMRTGERLLQNLVLP